LQATPSGRAADSPSPLETATWIRSSAKKHLAFTLRFKTFSSRSGKAARIF